MQKGQLSVNSIVDPLSDPVARSMRFF